MLMSELVIMDNLSMARSRRRADLEIEDDYSENSNADSVAHDCEFVDQFREHAPW